MKKHAKVFAVILALALSLSLAACGRQAGEPAPAEQPSEAAPAGKPYAYAPGERIACRAVVGRTLASIAAAGGEAPAVLDCDVGGSTGAAEYGAAIPDRLIQCGIQEENAASVAGGLAASGIPAVFAGFGMFSLGECYGQLRMNSFNHADVKVIATHCGLDVGEDGKAHQCIDYISLAGNLLDFELLVPADANQADRMLRYLLASGRPGILAVGRSAVPVLADGDGNARFGGAYAFEYGRADWLRPPGEAVIAACGGMAHRACGAADILARGGIRCGVLNISCPKELDGDALRRAAATGALVTYEDHNAATGLGSLVARYLMGNGLACRFTALGVARYGGSAPPARLYEAQGLDAAGAARAVGELLGKCGREVDKR